LIDERKWGKRWIGYQHTPAPFAVLKIYAMDAVGSSPALLTNIQGLTRTQSAEQAIKQSHAGMLTWRRSCGGWRRILGNQPRQVLSCAAS